MLFGKALSRVGLPMHPLESIEETKRQQKLHGIGAGLGAIGIRLLSRVPMFPAVVTSPDPVFTGSPLPRVEVRESPGRGSGLFAVDPIPAYTCFLVDEALLCMSSEGEDLPQLWQKYLLLPAELRDAFDALSCSQYHISKEASMVTKLRERGYKRSEATRMARINSIWQANAFKTNTPTTWAYGLSVTFARINHSCTPNAYNHFRPASGAQMVYSLRDIAAGEEIEVSYILETLPLRTRQARLKGWGFTCICPACSQQDRFAGDDYENALTDIRRGYELGVPGQTSLDNRGTTTTTAPRGVDLADAVNLRNRMARNLTATAISTAAKPEYPWLVAVLPSLWNSMSSLQVESEPDSDLDFRRSVEMTVQWTERVMGRGSPLSNRARQMLFVHERFGVAVDMVV